MIERSRVEERLAYQANLLAIATDAIIASDAEGQITYWNAGAERVYGWESDEVLGKSSDDIFLPVGDSTWSEGLPERQRILRSGGMVQGEYQRRRKDRTVIWIEFGARAFFDTDGQISGYVSVHRDITERKQTAQQLTEQAFLLAQVSDAVVRYDIDSTITYWSASATRLYGYSAEEALGRKSIDLLQTTYRRPGASREQVFAELERHGQYEVDLEQTTRDGRVIEVESRMTLLRDAHGHPVGVLGINRDVTERNRAARQLEQQAFLLAHVSDAVIGLDLDSRITYWSPSAERVLGYTSQEAVGQGSRTLLQSSYTNMTLEEGIDRLLETDLLEVENIQHTKDGRKLLEWNPTSRCYAMSRVNR